MSELNKTKIMREIPPEWDKLMRVAVQLNYGEITLKIKNGKPTLIEQSIKQIRLDDDQDFEDGLKTIPLV